VDRIQPRAASPRLLDSRQRRMVIDCATGWGQRETAISTRPFPLAAPLRPLFAQKPPKRTPLYSYKLPSSWNSTSLLRSSSLLPFHYPTIQPVHTLKMGWRCPKCEAILPDHYRICEGCGQAPFVRRCGRYHHFEGVEDRNMVLTGLVQKHTVNASSNTNEMFKPDKLASIRGR